MTTAILEQLFAATVALTSAPREAAAPAERPFRDLLADAPRDAEGPTPESCAAPPVAEPVADQSSDGPEESTDHEQARDDDDETIAAAAYALTVPAEPKATDIEIDSAEEATASIVEDEALPQARAPVKKLRAAPPAAAAGDVPEKTDDNMYPTSASGEKAAAAIEANQDATSVPKDKVVATAPAVNGDVVSETPATSGIVASRPAAEQHESLATEPEHGQAPRESNDTTRGNHPHDASTASVPDASPAIVNDVAVAEDNSQRPRSKPRETAKRDAAASESLQRPGAASDPVASAPPPAGPSVVTAPSQSNSLTTPDTSIQAAADAAAPRGEIAQTTAAEPLSAATERLGAMLGQRRVKLVHGGHGQALSESQQARLVQRVARAIDTARLRGEAEIRLRLSPPELGPLKLEVRLESGAMTVRLEVETAAAQQALAENLGALRQRLAEQNIRVEQFDIDLLDRNAGNESDGGARQPADGDRHAPQRGFGRNGEHRHATNTSSETQSSRVKTVMGSTSLDVLI